MENKNQFKSMDNDFGKLEDVNLEEPAGGFGTSLVGDYDTRKVLGIEGDIRLLHHNKYFLEGREIPKKFVEHIVKCYRDRDRYGDYEEELNKFYDFRDKLRRSDDDAEAFKFAAKRMNEIWRDYD